MLNYTAEGDGLVAKAGFHWCVKQAASASDGGPEEYLDGHLTGQL